MIYLSVFGVVCAEDGRVVTQDSKIFTRILFCVSATKRIKSPVLAPVRSERAVISVELMNLAPEPLGPSGVKASVTLNPSTPLVTIEHVLEQVDMVLLMTVNPGFGGQEFISAVIPKIRDLRRMIDKRGLTIDVEVDGGINAETVGAVARAGADVFVAGSAVFHTSNYGETLRMFRARIAEAMRE